MSLTHRHVAKADVFRVEGNPICIGRPILGCRLARVKRRTAEHRGQGEKNNHQISASAEVHGGLYKCRTAIRQGIYLLSAPFRVPIPEETETWNNAAKCSVL